MEHIRNFAVFSTYLNRSLTASFEGELTAREITFISSSFAHLFILEKYSVTLAIISLRELCDTLYEAGEMWYVPSEVYTKLSCHSYPLFKKAYRNVKGLDLDD